MEKYSAYRDPGTGIQPFLTPQPPVNSELAPKSTLPLRWIIATIRTALVLILAFVYIIVVCGIFSILAPIPPIHNFVTHGLTSIIGRLVLFVIGLFWIPVEVIARKRGRGTKATETWNPRAGDIIVSNWTSWIELVWLSVRFNPIFILPVAEHDPQPPTNSTTSGRQTGTGSANVRVANKSADSRVPIIGFQQISLLQIIRFTGNTPITKDNSFASAIQPLGDIIKSATRPVVVFPECTSSNGRGLLHFAEVFQEKVPVRKFQVFVMCIRNDPPTAFSPTATHSIPSNIFNPLKHLFTLNTSLLPITMSVRLLAPSESPSSQLFMAHEVVTGNSRDQLSESCAALIASMGKFKVTAMGWEDKARFLEFYANKRAP